MPSSSTSSTSSSVAATNPALNNLFTNIFSGISHQASDSIGGILSGQTMANNTSQLYSTLQKAGQPTFQKGLASVREAAGRAGLSNSTTLTGQLGSYTNEYLGNLSQISTQMGLQETQTQAGTAGNILGMLSTAGNQYFTNSTTSTQQMPWTSTFSSLMSAGLGIAGLGVGGGATLGGSALQGLFG